VAELVTAVVAADACGGETDGGKVTGSQRLAQVRQVPERDRVDQGRAHPCAPKLHEVCPLAVPVARRPFGVECDGSIAEAHSLDEVIELNRARDRLGNAVGGFAQQGDDGLVGLVGGRRIVRFDHVSPARAR